jgi:hypothetical protein
MAPDFTLAPNVLLFVLAAACGTLLLMVAVLLLALRRRRRTAHLPSVDLRIDVSQLPAAGPPAEGPVLEFYGMPVRLVALVLAPAGRNSRLPPREQLARTLDDLTPGLAAVVLEHRPLIREWPSQLSTQGFTHAFFNNVQLPSDRGKGTPWCSVAGRFDAGDQQLLAGLLCAAQKPNSMGQVTVGQVGQWLEVLRVKV